MPDPSMSGPSVESDEVKIVSTPGTCGGKPRIDGHRIRVQDVVVWTEQMGMTMDEILSDFPSMTPAKIRAALAYYTDHRDEIQADFDADRELDAELDRTLGSALIRIPRMNDGVNRADSPR